MKLKTHLTNINDFTIGNLGLELKQFSKSNDVVYSKLMKNLRKIISGLEASIKIKCSFLLYYYIYIITCSKVQVLVK